MLDFKKIKCDLALILWIIMKMKERLVLYFQQIDSRFFSGNSSDCIANATKAHDIFRHFKISYDHIDRNVARYKRWPVSITCCVIAGDSRSIGRFYFATAAPTAGPSISDSVYIFCQFPYTTFTLLLLLRVIDDTLWS